MKTVDTIVIGGGISGATVALGLLRHGSGRVAVLDEQLPSQRLSRGNFGLTWFMCKGSSFPAYAKICRLAAMQWPEFGARLEEETGYDMELEWTGGAIHAFGEEELDSFASSVKHLTEVCGGMDMDYPVQMLDRQEFAGLIPRIGLGDEVAGAMYTTEQGHVNPLKLLAAVRCAFQKLGGEYHAAAGVREIIPQKDGSVVVKSVQGEFSCQRVVVAAGHGSTRLLAPLGETLPIYPQRGQIMVSERCERVLDIPLLSLRQTVDGTFMIGLSTENTALDTHVTPEAMKNQAEQAIRLFPMLGRLNWVRGWGAVRVMTPDGAPIFSRLKEHRNITVVALHSGVSLAPIQASMIAPWVLGQGEDELITQFGNGRFNV